MSRGYLNTPGTMPLKAGATLPKIHSPLTSHGISRFTTTDDHLHSKMLTNLIPFAVLFSASLLSSATPLDRRTVPAVPTTVTIYQCPTATVSVGASISTTGISTEVASLLTALNQVGPAITQITGVIPALLNTITNIIGSLLGSTNQVQTTVNGLVTQIQPLTGAVGSVNTILSNLASGAAGASAGAQVSTLAQGLTTQVTNLANQVGTVISGCKSSGATVNLVPLQQELQTLLSGCQVGSTSQSPQHPLTALPM
ncbi:hypothetical protein C8R44DRAFT_62398 [Mycena epipterygia]|nr:hypothetical protein C8R44DRAFT_62398 [Mycena epipterygia]